MDEDSLSAFDLYKSRIAQYIGEQSLEQEACVALLPEEDRAKLSDFIRDFQEKHLTQEMKRLNRFFDELARSRQLYEQFKDALFAAFPEAGQVSWLTMKWVNNYLYTQLKPTFKLEILSVNENVCARYIPADMLVDIWEKCGEHDKRIDRLIYAARHVDVGISMCNIQEVQEGIQQLRDLSADEHSWTNAGKSGEQRHLLLLRRRGARGRGHKAVRAAAAGAEAI